MAGIGEETDVNPDDLLAIADSLASGRVGTRRGRPRQAELRRAISAAYYALFHALATNCANLLVGARTSTETRQAWRQAYRSLHHGQIKRKCTEGRSKRVMRRFPHAVQDFADQFVKMQRLRHLADYDPFEHFVRYEVVQFIGETKTAIGAFEKADRSDRRAFGIFVLFDLRRD